MPTEDERRRIEDYTVNICVTGPGGSLGAAKGILAAGAAVLAAGGAGVWVDNSGIAHGATDWLTLLDSADDGGMYWAFVSVMRTEDALHSMGMHVLGCRDAIVPRTGDDEFDLRTLHSFLGYTAFSGATLNDGDMVGDPVLPNFRVKAEGDESVPAEAPMHNGYGRWRLVRIDELLN